MGTRESYRIFTPLVSSRSTNIRALLTHSTARITNERGGHTTRYEEEATPEHARGGGNPCGPPPPPRRARARQPLTDAYKSASSSISNADVKNAVDDLAKDAQAVTDQIKAVYVENDLSKLGEYTTAIQNMTSHQETLSNLCDVNN